MNSENHGGVNRFALLAQAGLLAFAAVYWGMFAGASKPFVYHPDESAIISRAVRMVVTGNLNPHWFHYPTLLTYLHAATVLLLKQVLNLRIELGMPMLAQGAHPDVFVIYHVARLITVCFSVATLYLLLMLASRLTSPFMALWAGLVFVGSSVVRDSAMYVTVDMPMTFFVMATLILTVKFLDSARAGTPRERYIWLAAIAGGLAAGTKYNGAAVLVTIPLAVWLAGMPLKWSVWRLPMAAMLSVIVFLATTPYAILDIKTFLDPKVGMIYDFVHYSAEKFERESPFVVFRDLIRRHSPLVLLAFLSPFAMRDGNERKTLALVSAVPILFLIMICIARLYFPRNFLPSLPALDCLSAAGIWFCIGMSFAHDNRKQTIVRTVIPLLVVSAVTLYVACGTWRQTRGADTRTLAYEWITETLPPGTRILCEAYSPQVYFSPNYEVTYTWTISSIQFEEVIQTFDYVVVSSTQWRRFGEKDTYERLFTESPVREWKRIAGKVHGPSIRVYATGRRDATKQGAGRTEYLEVPDKR